MLQVSAANTQASLVQSAEQLIELRNLAEPDEVRI